jgi:L-ribulose-5-phosphate 4-epimerase
MLEDLKSEVYRTLMGLLTSGLVQGTSGNVSGREGDFVVIKPSGVSYSQVTPDHLVVLDLQGHILEGGCRPSVDTPAHLCIYRSAPEAGGIVHTHSPYATAFAVLGRSIPVYLTELADLFGGPIPVSEYVPPGDEAIGREFAAKTGSGRFRALLMRSHGVFTAGYSAADALIAAMIVEHSAMVSYLAEQADRPVALPDEETARLHRQYMEGYGQTPTKRQASE